MALDKKVSYTGQNQVDTLSSKVRLEEGKGRLLAFDGSNNLGLFGYDDAGQVVVKIAKPGFDANSATDDQLIFNSNQNIFKITVTNTINHTLSNTSNIVPAGTQTLPIPHPFGYNPAFIVYIETPTTYIGGQVRVQLPDLYVLPAGHSLGGGTIFSQFKARVDPSNLYIDFFHRVSTDYSPSLPIFKIKYYLLQETAT